MGKRKKATPKPRGPSSAGFVADLHGGSKWGLFPPKWTAPGSPSHTVKPNIGQQWLWKWWMWTAQKWRDVLGGDLDLLVINGDATDGKQPRSRATGLITADLQEQADIAYHCLAPFVDVLKPSKILRTSGTDYHEGPDNPLPALDEKLGIRCSDEFNIETEAGALQCQHDPGTTGAIYKGTVIDREILWSIIAGALRKAPSANVIVRSHLHYFHQMQTHGKTFVLTPCWMLQPKYAKKKNRYRWTPDIGGVLLVRDSSAYGGYRTHVKDIPLPPYEREAVPYGAI